MSKFPRIIHQCFLGFDGPIPQKWANNHTKWKNAHPNYEVKLWNMEESVNLINQLDPSFLKIFNNYQYNVERADAIRYFILYKFGGIYVDLDIISNYPIDSLIEMYENDENLDVLLGQSPSADTASNFFMISKKESNFWILVINEMKKRINKPYIGKHLTIMNETGPLLVDDAMKMYNQNNKNYVEILSKSILNSCDVCGKCDTKFNYIIDDHASSWHSLDSKIVNFLNCNVYRHLKNINILVYIFLLIIMFVIILKK